MHNFRVTFPDRYPPTSPGHSDPSARQGYYVTAENKRVAWSKMREQHPYERIEVEPLD